MKPLSASAAAKAVGKSVPTITRAIKSGKITAKTLEKGGYEIDPSELFRVFPAVTPESDVKPTTLGTETPNDTRALEAELNAKDREIDLLRSQLDDTREDRDEWRKQANQLALAPPSQNNTPEAATERAGGFLGLFGRKKA